MSDKIEGTVQKADGDIFTEEALRSQDGKKVPLTLETGGPVIGEATLHYDEDEQALMASFDIEDPKMTELLKGSMPSAPTTIKFKTKES